MKRYHANVYHVIMIKLSCYHDNIVMIIIMVMLSYNNMGYHAIMATLS
jgi:hypothetical protein